MSNKPTKNTQAIERGKRVRFLRSHVAAMTGVEFAEYCGVHARGTITNWETGKGKNGLTEKGAKQIIQAMKNIGIECKVEWLLHGEGETPKIFDQNKLSRLHYPLSEPQPIDYMQEKRPAIEDFSEEITLFEKRHFSPLIFTLKDDSMSPMYQIGDCVGGPRLMPHEFTLIQGCVCIILLPSEKYLLRYVRLENDGTNTISFYVVDAAKTIDYPTVSRISLDDVVSIAPVTRLWKKIKPR